MSLQAPARSGLTLAALRDGLARGLGAAGPAARRYLGVPALDSYRSPFPSRLRAFRVAVVVMAALWLGAGLYGLGATSGMVRTLGHDTAPSVSAAEGIRTGLAAANADFALSTLTAEGADGPFLSDMRRRLRLVREGIVVAAGNVTFGDEEDGPIRTILQGLGDYEQIVGRSVASAGDARNDLAFAADDLLHWTVLPAAVTLERVNADHLAEAYRAYAAREVVPWMIEAAALFLLLLVVVQFDAARSARRLVNPGLAVSTLVLLAATAYVVVRLMQTQSDLHVAKVDAFDSVYALSSARALAADADAAETFALLAHADASRAERYRAQSDALSARLLSASAGDALIARENGERVPGFLGDELGNISFPGEKDAAVAAVRAWGEVVRADAALRGDDARGARGIAASSKTADTSGTARHAFASFDAKLRQVLTINQDAFAASVGAAEGDEAPVWAALVAGFAAILAAAWLGIRQRLEEYRF